MPKDVADKPRTAGHKDQPKQPDDQPLGTFTLYEHFRTYVYCVKPQRKCLGYFEWNYQETYTFFLHWSETKASLGSALGTNTGRVGGRQKSDTELKKDEDERVKTWEASIISKDSRTGPTEITGWKPDCK